MISDEIKQARREMLAGMDAAGVREVKAHWAVIDAKDALVDAVLAAEERLQELHNNTRRGSRGLQDLLEALQELHVAEQDVANL